MIVYIFVLCIYIQIPISALFKQPSIAQLVEVTDSAVLGGVAGVVSSNPTVGHKNILAFTGIVDLLYLSIYIKLILYMLNIL